MTVALSKVVGQINRRNLSTNIQKVAYRLLSAASNGTGWVKNTQLSHIPSVGSRIRDLRTEEFGSWKVQCATASELNKDGDQYTFFYRVVPSSVNQTQLRSVFGT